MFQPQSTMMPAFSSAPLSKAKCTPNQANQARCPLRVPPIGSSTSHLCHGPFVQILEWLGLRALQQPFDGFPDVASGLKRGGPESGQHVTSFAVRDGRDIADGEDSRMVFHLEVGSNRNAAAMNQLDAQG